MTDKPQYVIVHRRIRPHVMVDMVHDVDPDDDLNNIRERAADLQATVVPYGRPNDTYRVAELRYLDEDA